VSEFYDLLNYLSTLRALEIILLVMVAAIIFIGPTIIKKQYLKRNNMVVDNDIEDRNSWIFIPKQYNVLEKVMMVIVYISSFILLIIAINLELRGHNI